MYRLCTASGPVVNFPKPGDHDISPWQAVHLRRYWKKKALLREDVESPPEVDDGEKDT